jgi:PAS domain S-box-containing protein
MSLTRLDNSQFIAVNDAFLKATGYSESEVIGRFAQDLNLYADPEQRLEFIEILRRDGMARDREHLVRRKDGSTFTALITGDIIDIDGRPHTLTVALDITARKKAEQDTLRALDAERELGELKSRFVSLVSHEFRTPLGITMSAVELLRNYLDRLPAAKRAELLDDIYSATLRMSDLMEQVLLLGRVEAGKVLFKPVPIDLVSFAGRIIDETLSATHHRCPVTVTGTRDAAEAIADEALLRPILSNLLTNAIKYSDEGRPVRVGISRTGDEAVFTVTDQGIGIPEADHPRLFEAFHRASNVEHVSGTGLGLLIVRRCVDLHQGRIDFESRLGEGTTFRVHIPAYPISLT